MINKFEVGKRYRWIGPQKLPPPDMVAGWDDSNMIKILDGKPRKALAVKIYEFTDHRGYRVDFQGIGTYVWSKDIFQYFELVGSTKIEDLKPGLKVKINSEGCCGHPNKSGEEVTISFIAQDKIIVIDSNSVAWKHNPGCVEKL